MFYVIKNNSRRPVFVLGQTLSSALSSGNKAGKMSLSEEQFLDYSVQKLLQRGVIVLHKAPKKEEAVVIEPSPVESISVEPEVVVFEPESIPEEVVVETKEVIEDIHTKDSLNLLSYSELKVMAKDLDLKISGRKKSTIVNKLLEYYNG